ncbi:three-Cys-motif partner protein TcmP [Streptomyces sp. GF20]|nr:three-Cys-motif partner protein TcmP [Streptomyces sp. GF20]
MVYLDGYAGPGRYEDGTPGSPALILDSAARIAGFRQLDCYFVERAPKNYQSLAALVSEASAQGLAAQALKGHVEKHLGQILDRAAGAPLFAFLDPFGLGLSFETLTQQIFGSRQRPRNHRTPRDGGTAQLQRQRRTPHRRTAHQPQGHSR